MTVLPPNQFISDSGAMYATPEEAAVANPSPQAHATAADISELMEIADARFKLDVGAFMAAIEDVPLFLRRAG